MKRGELAKLTVEAEAESPTGWATNERKGHSNHRSAGEELWRPKDGDQSGLAEMND